MLVVFLIIVDETYSPTQVFLKPKLGKKFSFIRRYLVGCSGNSKKGESLKIEVKRFQVSESEEIKYLVSFGGQKN